MNKFYELKNDYDKKYQEEFSKTGVFWAFSNKQFEQNKTHKNAPDSEYLSVGLGGYIHKSNLDKLNYFNEVISKKLKDDFVKKINIDDLIEYELKNHECYYTGDYMEILPIIEDYLNTDISERNDIIEQIEIVYKNTYRKNMEAFDK